MTKKAVARPLCRGGPRHGGPAPSDFEGRGEAAKRTTTERMTRRILRTAIDNSAHVLAVMFVGLCNPMTKLAVYHNP